MRRYCLKYYLVVVMASKIIWKIVFYGFFEHNSGTNSVENCFPRRSIHFHLIVDLDSYF